jgi:hypothetical protein
MSIQEQINQVDNRVQLSQRQFFFVVFAIAVTCIFTDDWGYAIAFLVAYIPLSMGLNTMLSSWRESRVLEIYRYACRPVFEIQYVESDSQVLKRAEAHRQKLTESGNEIWKQGLITVEELYYRDVRFGYAESPEEIALKREDFMRDFVNAWGLSLTKENQLFIKKWLYGQEIEDKTTVIATEATPSVLEVQTGDYWANQFPLLTKLMRGNGRKEVEAA